MNTKKITYTAILLAIALLLPQVFHLSGVNNSGAVLLPMHIPVLLAGLILGPLSGLVVGLLAPIMSTVLTGMPTIARLPFMIVELAVYGLASGCIFHYTRLHKTRMGSLIALFMAMLLGRLAYALMILLLSNLLGVTTGGLEMVVTAITLGIPGIIIQLLFIPSVVELLKARGYIRGIIEQS